MGRVIASAAKYTITLLMVLYTWGAFSVFRTQNIRKLKWNYVKQNMLALLIHGVGFAVLLVNEPSLSLAVLYGAELVFFLVYLKLYRFIYKKANLALLNHMILLLSVGSVMLARLDAEKAGRQFIMICLAAMMTLVVPKMFARLKAARLWAAVAGVIGLLLLSAVLAMSKTYGANLSFDLGFISIQPSEFVKISYVLLMAVLFRERHDLTRVLFASSIAGIHIIVLVMSTDLGGALIYSLTFLLVLFVATKKSSYLLIGTIGGAGAAILAYQLFLHVRTRVQTWIDPWPMFSGKGNQIGNSLFGIATGGLFGTGLTRGSPDFIPIVEKDFLFSAISEEMGGIVGLCLILICIACLMMFIFVSADLYLDFYKLTGVGLACIFAVQVLLTIGGNIKFIPLTGVTLPLVSYGGSSMFSTFIIFGIVQELYIKKQNEVERIEKRNEERRLAKQARMETGTKE